MFAKPKRESIRYASVRNEKQREDIERWVMNNVEYIGKDYKSYFRRKATTHRHSPSKQKDPYKHVKSKVLANL